MKKVLIYAGIAIVAINLLSGKSVKDIIPDGKPKPDASKGGISLPSDLTVKPGVDTGPKVTDGITVTPPVTTKPQVPPTTAPVTPPPVVVPPPYIQTDPKTGNSVIVTGPIISDW
ncbi:hypothetical protein [Elizabethkingia miricola]|uniref:hypothetical protein n=1 Tax=Elizabethkingia miricola TaxID=172045 RepID=UPI0009996EF3|nr:hypothetical protein [Elizabethkingia miricola]OPC37695.1 hypothetical protein BAX99_16560 [Elizabethkingia miricola]